MTGRGVRVRVEGRDVLVGSPRLLNEAGIDAAVLQPTVDRLSEDGNDRMRSDASPQMVRQMETDPMTQMMRSGEMTRMAEQHQSEVDRMLGRASGN